MKLITTRLAIVALLLPALAARAAAPLVGEEHEITRSYETAQEGSSGSSGSSSGSDTLIERVIAVRDSGIELEFDLAREAGAGEKASNWQFPVRVLSQPGKPMQLINAAELEARVEAWLKAAKWTRTVCGKWIFTWNAFRIECDPQSVLATLEAIDLRSVVLVEGALYREAGAAGAAKLVRSPSARDGITYTAVMEADPQAVRLARAESDVVVGEITQTPVTLEAALGKRAKESVSGTITVTFDADEAGNVRRKTKVTKLETRLADGERESETDTQTIERRPRRSTSAAR